MPKLRQYQRGHHYQPIMYDYYVKHFNRYCQRKICLRLSKPTLHSVSSLSVGILPIFGGCAAKTDCGANLIQSLIRIFLPQFLRQNFDQKIHQNQLKSLLN